MSRHKKHPPHEEHADETWLIPYADLLTLLLALFIVLFASSQVDKGKLARVAQSVDAAFSGPFSSAPSGGVISIGPPGGGPGQRGETTFAKGETPIEMELKQLSSVKNELEGYIKSKNLDNDLETVMTDQGLIIRIKDTTLFPSGSADLGVEARDLTAKIAEIVGSVPQTIIITGHTDNVPINTPRYPSNWDLSAQRALNVMKYMLEVNPEITPQRFSTVGYGEYRPLSLNDTAEGRAKNRRVEVLVQRQYLKDSEKKL